MSNHIRFYSVAAYLVVIVAAWRIREIIRNRSLICGRLETFRYNVADHIGGLSFRYGEAAERADRWAHRVLREA